MSLAEQIQTLRKQKGISQEELANRIGVSRQAVSKWESGQSAPDIDKIVSLSQYFGVTTDHLLQNEGTLLFKSEEDAETSLLKDEVSEEEYRYAVRERGKKKRAGYWIGILIPPLMIAAILLLYFFVFR